LKTATFWKSTNTRRKVVEHNDVGKAFIDEGASEEIDYEIVRERKKLSFSGLITLVVAVDKETKRLKGEPQITASGVAGINPLNGLLQNARQSISDVVEETDAAKYRTKNSWRKLCAFI
jgi:mRNA degradation ribonuclease J1/J2